MDGPKSEKRRRESESKGREKKGFVKRKLKNDSKNTFIAGKHDDGHGDDDDDVDEDMNDDNINTAIEDDDENNEEDDDNDYGFNDDGKSEGSLNGAPFQMTPSAPNGRDEKTRDREMR